MTKNLIEISNQLKQEIENIVINIDGYVSHEERIKKEKYEEDQNQSKEKQLKKAETYFDLLHESYQRCIMIDEEGNEMRKLMQQFQYTIDVYIEECERKKEEIGNEMNSMLDIMKEKEKSIKEINEKYEKENYIDFYSETELVKKKREEERKQEELKKRYPIVKNYLTIDEMDLIEKEIGRYVDKKIFDSNEQNWKIKYSEFERFMKNQSHVIIMIETTENKKFGCYISKEINQKGSYIEDSEAFIFTFDSNGNPIEKYSILDSSFAIEISNNSDDNLFVIGKNDIVIKKEGKKTKCSCKQTSYEYKGKENVLIGRKGNFEVQSIVVFGMELTEEEKELKQLQQIEE